MIRTKKEGNEVKVLFGDDFYTCKIEAITILNCLCDIAEKSDNEDVLYDFIKDIAIWVDEKIEYYGMLEDSDDSDDFEDSFSEEEIHSEEFQKFAQVLNDLLELQQEQLLEQRQENLLGKKKKKKKKKKD